MKKIYMKPQMEAIEIKMQSVIAASGPGYGGPGGGAGAAPFMQDWDEDLENFDNITTGFDTNGLLF
jgi:hypothetical protein